MNQPPGTPFGQYRLITLLGRGGMGEVWRAHDTVTDRIVALKLLPARFAEDSVFKERFRREAHAAARLNEPHVVPIHTYGEIDGHLFVDMRLIEGRDVETVLAEGPLSPARAVLIIEQVAKAVHAAHRVGLVHRDIKPSNILLDDDDFAYLIDFGIARAAGETGLTATGGVVGTMRYMAPERFSTGDADARSDIYALACVLYECLTGNRPFPGDSMEQQVAGHLAAPPPRPSDTGAPVVDFRSWQAFGGIDAKISDDGRSVVLDTHDTRENWKAVWSGLIAPGQPQCSTRITASARDISHSSGVTGGFGIGLATLQKDASGQEAAYGSAVQYDFGLNGYFAVAYPTAQSYSLVPAPLDHVWHEFDIAIDENGWITADVDGNTVLRAKGNAVCGTPTLRVWAGSAEFRDFSVQAN